MGSNWTRSYAKAGLSRRVHRMIDTPADVDGEECCGSGCNNCVLDRQVHQCQPSEKSAPNLFDGTYRTFRSASIDSITANVKRLRFVYEPSGACEADTKLSLFVPPTMHLFVRIPASTGNANKHDKSTAANYISRPYTPIASDPHRQTFDVLIKIEQHGRLSRFFDGMQVGDQSEWKGCYGHFRWQPARLSIKHLVCICQGVAIAPMFALISSILSNERDETTVHLVVCFKNLENHLLRKELSDFRRFWNFTSVVYLSQEQKCEICTRQNTENCACLKRKLLFNEIVRNYRLDGNDLRRFYASLKSNSIFTVFCGTERLKCIVETEVDALDDDIIKRNFICLE